MTVSSIAGRHYGFAGYLGTIPQTVVMSRAVNMTIDEGSYPLTAITFDDAYTGAGAYTDVLEDMTVLVYSGNTSTLKGRLRVAAGGASSTVLQVNEFSQGTLDLADNDRIDVVAEWRIWDKLIEAAAAFRKDSRITFTDQTDAYRPTANGGGCWFGFVDSGQTYATVQHDWATSAVVDPDNTGGLEYLADVGDGTITVGVDTDDTITVRYPAGFRWVTLTVTDADNGESSSKQIPVYVYDDSTYTPLKVKVDSRAYTHDSGWSLTFSVPSGTEGGLTSLPDGAMVVYFEDERYNGTKVSYGSNAPTERSHIKFVGFLVRDSIRVSADGDEVTFEALGPLGILEQTAALPQLMIRDATPNRWTELREFTVQLGFDYVLRWSASLPFDVIRADGHEYDYSRLAIEDDSNLAAQLRDLASAINIKLTCDRLGRLILKRDPNYGGTGDRAGNPTLYAITVSDFMELEFATEHRSSVKFVRGEGIKEHTSTSGARALFSNAPGDAPGEGTTTETLSRQVWFGASDANERTGHHYAKLNGLFYDTSTKAITHVPQGASVTLADSYDFIDPALLQWVTLTLPASTNSRGRSFTSSTRWLVDSMDVSYSDGSVKDVRATISHETRGVPGVSYYPPQSSDNGLPTLPGLDLTLPGFGDIVPVVSDTPLLEAGLARIGIVLDDGTIALTSTFNAPSPTWGTPAAVSSLSGAALLFVEQAGSSPKAGWIITSTDVEYVADLANAAPSSTSQLTFGASSVLRAAEADFVDATRAGQRLVIASYYKASGGVKAIVTTDGGSTWGSETSVDGGNNYETNLADYCPGVGIDQITGRIYVSAFSSTDADGNSYIYYSDNSGGAWTQGADGADEGLAGDIYVPYNGSKIYYGRTNDGFGIGAIGRFLDSANLNAGSQSFDRLSSYGPHTTRPRWGIHAPTTNPLKLYFAGVNGAKTSSGIWMTTDDGVTATAIVAASSGNAYKRVAALDPDGRYAILFGTNGAIALYDSVTGILSDRIGNLSTSAEILGIFGW